MRKARAHRSKLPRQTEAIPEEKISAGKRATSVEDGNSTDSKDKAGRTIAALSTKAPAKPNGIGSMEYGQMDAGRRNSSAEDKGKGNKNAPVQEWNAGRRNCSAEDRKSAGCKGKGSADDKDPVDSMDKARGTIELATTKGSTRDRSLRMPTQANGMKGVDGT